MMRSYILLVLFTFLVDGVFGDTVEVMEGDAFTLNINVAKEEHETMRWYFKDIRIALINRDPSKNCLYDGPDEIFRDRLEVDFETGSLTIKNTRPEHSGYYEAEIIRSVGSGNTLSLNQKRKCNSTKITPKSSNSGETIKKISLTVKASFPDKNKNEPQKASQDQKTNISVFGDTVEVMEGDSFTLNINVAKEEHETMRWYFKDIRIALINGDPSKNCLYDGPDEIFRDRLEVDFETGSLTIKNTRPEHSGYYEAEIIRSVGSGNTLSLNQKRKCNSTKITLKSSNSGETIKIFSLTVKASFPDKNKNEPQNAPQDQKTNINSGLSPAVPDSGPSPAVVAGICGGCGFVLAVAVAIAVIYHRNRSSGKDLKKNKEEVLRTLNDETEKDGGHVI